MQSTPSQDADPSAINDVGGFDPFAGMDLARTVPTTEPQREVWLASQMDADASLAYNESVTLRLTGVLDAAALEAAVRDVCERHESLRATISPDGLQLLIAREPLIEWRSTDLSSGTPVARERGLREAQRAHVRETLPVEQGPLLRTELIALSAQDHALLLTTHHVVCDGWSFGILLRDLGEAYSTRRKGVGKPDAPTAPQFGDYALERAALLHSEPHKADEKFWLERVSGAEQALDLPMDRERRAPRSYRSERVDFTLEAPLVAALRKTGASRGASLFAVLLAGYVAFAHRISDQREFIVGIPAAGQNAEGWEGLIGHCVHVLPLSVRVDPAQSFGDLLAQVRASMLDAFEHQGYTFSELLRKLAVKRDAGRPTLVSTLFNLDQEFSLAGLFEGLDASWSTNPRAFENFDLSLNVVPSGGDLRVETQYAAALLEPATIQRWLDSWHRLLGAIVTTPDGALGSLDLLGASDQEAWARFNSTAAPFDQSASVWSLFDAACNRSPQLVAAIGSGTQLSYAELRQEARVLAARMSALGVVAGDRVGISVERNPRMLVAMLACLGSGVAYVPLEPAFPRERLQFMANDAQLKLILVDPEVAPLWQAWPSPLLDITAADAAALAAADRWQPAAAADSTAYVIYTSGSTGTPKGVRLGHRAVVNFLSSMAREPGLAQGDRVLAVTTLSFDIAVLELLLPLCQGATAVIASRDDAIDGRALRGLLEKHEIALMQATPTTWRLLLESGWESSPALTALCGGEALPADLARELVPRVRSLWNMYGPTETTVWSAVQQIRGNEEQITIGHPIANTQIYVLQDNGTRNPVGVRGEIWIGGDGLAEGYWNRPELNAQRFVRGAMPEEPDTVLYRTGDLGRLRADGTLECLGRTDFQVKIRGHRIELGEIEALVSSHAGVARCVAEARGTPTGEKSLCAYVVFKPGQKVEFAELRALLRGRLPEYMVPAAFIELAAIPLTPNGKVDRKALPDPDPSAFRSAAAQFQSPQTPMETRLAGVWSELLSTPQVGRQDNFFDLGGHSLLAMRAIARMEQLEGHRISPANYVLETLSQIAMRYTTASATAAAPAESPAGERAGFFSRLIGRNRGGAE